MTRLVRERGREKIGPGVLIFHQVLQAYPEHLPVNHGRVEHRHLQAYLDEYAFRFNRRKSRYVGKIFFRLLQQGTQTKPISYRTLVAASPKRNHKRLGLHDCYG